MNGLGRIVGAIAGAISAMILTIEAPWFGHVFRSDCSQLRDSPVVTRALPWAGGASVAIHVPGTVSYQPGSLYSARATGPQALLEHLRVNDGRLEFDESIDSCDAKLNVFLTGPAVRHWGVAGSGDLLLSQLNQDDLDLDVEGSGSATVSGHVRHTRADIRGSGNMDLNSLEQTSIDLDIAGSGSASAVGRAEVVTASLSGSGDARFGRLNVKNAKVRITGSGNADIAAENSVDIKIQGSGSVRMLKQPKSMQTSIQGSGDIVSPG